MRTLLLMRRPLPRRVLVTAHLSIQLALLAAAAGWTVQNLTPIGPDNSLLAQWPVVALGVGGFLLAFVMTRLLFELLMAPHHLLSMRGNTPSLDAASVVTRSISRRPAVHDNDDNWVGKPRSVTWPREGEGEDIKAMDAAPETATSETATTQRARAPEAPLAATSMRASQEPTNMAQPTRQSTKAPAPLKQQEPSLGSDEELPVASDDKTQRTEPSL